MICYYILLEAVCLVLISCLFYIQLVSLEVDTKCYDAFNYGRREEALRLLKHVKDPLTVKSKTNFTLLHCAAYHGWLDITKELINDHQFDPDCKDDDGNTPLSKARSNGKQSVVDYLETVIGTFVVIIIVVQSAECLPLYRASSRCVEHVCLILKYKQKCFTSYFFRSRH